MDRNNLLLARGVRTALVVVALFLSAMCWDAARGGGRGLAIFSGFAAVAVGLWATRGTMLGRFIVDVARRVGQLVDKITPN